MNLRVCPETLRGLSKAYKEDCVAVNLIWLALSAALAKVRHQLNTSELGQDLLPGQT